VRAHTPNVKIFLNSVTLTRNIELSEDDLNNDRNMLERFQVF